MSELQIKAQITEKAEDSFTAVASSEVEDRQGEVVAQDGWDLKNFKKNPILLYMHDHTKPLGKATRVWLDKTGAKPILKFKGVISTATDYGKAAKQLMEEGILNSFSVGFRALELDGNTITKAELFEISLVSVPANPEARLLAAKSLEKAGFDQSVIKDVVGEEEDKDEIITELRKQLEDTNKIATEALKKADDAVKGLQHLAPHRSKQEVVSKRLQLSKVMAKTADKLIVESNSPKTVSYAKLIKRTSEKLIQDSKKEL
jgi:HK97 family phage prohead protease